MRDEPTTTPSPLVMLAWYVLAVPAAVLTPLAFAVVQAFELARLVWNLADLTLLAN